MTESEVGEPSEGRYNPSNWPLVGKLVAIGLLPALFIVALGVLRISDQVGAAADLGAANRLLQVRQQVADAATALREERDRATLFVAARRQGDRAPLDAAVGRTDAAVATARAGMAEVDDIVDAPTRAALRQADGRFDQLPAIRTSVTGTALLLPGQVLQRYTFIVNRADGLDRAVVRQVQQAGESSAVGLADALVSVTAAAEAVELEHTIVGVPLIAEAVTPEDRNAAAAADSTFITSYISYEVALPQDVEPVNFVTADANSARGAVRSAVLLGPTDGPVTVEPAEWDAVSSGARDVVMDAERRVATALTDAGVAAENRSIGQAWLNAAILLLGLLLTAVVVAFVTRSLTGSLRSLRASALDIAYVRLPRELTTVRAGGPDVVVEPVPLRSRDEVGEVARAFDVVHGEAVRLAADQAALQAGVNSMFANLSLRSTGLVDRQLQLIEQLERHDLDDEQRSDLVQLDHIAARMRRNSQNLLVLAGTDAGLQNTAPVPLADLLRAAATEVEQEQRIRLAPVPPVTVVGHVVADVVHILTELLDNATNFSPPDTDVVMGSTRLPDGSVLVEIADLGVGMNARELADANLRLSTPAEVDVATSRRMGLLVVGRLGARHGITVGVSGARTDGADDGVTASVVLPAHVVLPGAEPPAPVDDRVWSADPVPTTEFAAQRGTVDPGPPSPVPWPDAPAARDPEIAPLFDPGDDEPVAPAPGPDATPLTDPFAVVVAQPEPVGRLAGADLFAPYVPATAIEPLQVELREQVPVDGVSAWFTAHDPTPVPADRSDEPAGSGDPADDPLPAPAASGPATGVNGVQPWSTRAFVTAADEGWRASAAVEAQPEMTAAGLPKRRPHARLVPGSAVPAGPAVAAPQARDAEKIRDLLASHQHGVRQGRRIDDGPAHGIDHGDGAGEDGR